MSGWRFSGFGSAFELATCCSARRDSSVAPEMRTLKQYREFSEGLPQQVHVTVVLPWSRVQLRYEVNLAIP
jgi:hypothetical protein